MLVGALVGALVSMSVGVLISVLVGALVGVLIVALVGVLVGVLVSMSVGALVGMSVGVLIGVLVGVLISVLDGVLIVALVGVLISVLIGALIGALPVTAPLLVVLVFQGQQGLLPEQELAFAKWFPHDPKAPLTERAGPFSESYRKWKLPALPEIQVQGWGACCVHLFLLHLSRLPALLLCAVVVVVVVHLRPRVLLLRPLPLCAGCCYCCICCVWCSVAMGCHAAAFACCIYVMRALSAGAICVATCGFSAAFLLAAPAASVAACACCICHPSTVGLQVGWIITTG